MVQLLSSLIYIHQGRTVLEYWAPEKSHTWKAEASFSQGEGPMCPQGREDKTCLWDFLLLHWVYLLRTEGEVMGCIKFYTLNICTLLHVNYTIIKQFKKWLSIFVSLKYVKYILSLRISHTYWQLQSPTWLNLVSIQAPSVSNLY